MSSSSYIRRPEWVDLGRGEPPARPAHFDERVDFAGAQQALARELTPDEAYRNGLAEGEQRGRDATLKELVPALDELRRVAQAMARVREQRLADVESELLEIGSEVARRILRAELRQDGAAVLHLARACLQEAADEGPLTLRVAPTDLELVRAHLPELELELADASAALRGDPAIEPGNVVLETPRRVYDGRAERILDLARGRAAAQRGRA
jgi:flagellar biosynthesis/type III secretory pathway protein FliH